MSFKPTVFFILLFLIQTSVFHPTNSLYAQPAKERARIAVLPFTDTNPAAKKEANGEAIAGMLMTELINGKVFQVVERSEIQKIMNEIGLGQAGVVDPNTAQKIGKVYGVDLLVLGNVAKFGARVETDIRLVTTENGEALHAENAASNSEMEIRTMVVNLARKIEQRYASAGALTMPIQSTPAGATVYIDNKMEGKTPLTRTLRSGVHVVRLELDGFQTWEQTVTLANNGQLVTAQLAAEPEPTPAKAKKGSKKWLLLTAGAGAAGAAAYFILKPKAEPEENKNSMVTISITIP